MVSSLDKKNLLIKLYQYNCHKSSLYLANDSCDTGSVRLVNGTTMFDGIVEVCLNEVWGNIIMDYHYYYYYYYEWNTPAAEVVCRQLGLSWGCES